MKKWKILHSRENTEKTLSSNSIFSFLLTNRGLHTENEIQSFLYPRIKDITAESLDIDLKELEWAIKRIIKAIKQKESIIVYADYDADGICAGAILWETIYGLGGNVMPYIPHRIKEGYGLSRKGIDFVKDKYNAGLIITVDHGVTAQEYISYARKRGIDCIVTDHHMLPARRLESFALVHTTALCGSGVAWMLAKALRSSKNEFKNTDILHEPYQQLELVAIATIADIIPLIGPNRTLVLAGLKALNETKRKGLLALMEESGLHLGSINTYEVGYILAPRINAMGRLTHAIDALRLLCTRNYVNARKLALLLSSTNRERQQKTHKMYLHAKKLHDQMSNDEKLIFIQHKSYSEGVIGLIAGKLTSQYYKPSIVVATRDKYSKASARSIKGFNIVEAIRTCSDLLVDCGGHPMAAGFTVQTDKIDILRQRLWENASKHITDKMLTQTITIDCYMNPNEITWDLLKKIKVLAPFGKGNQEPLFATKRVRISDYKSVGNGKHLKLRLADFPEYEVIGFGFGQYGNKLIPNKPIDIAYNVEENTFNGRTRLQLRLKDLKIPSL